MQSRFTVLRAQPRPSLCNPSACSEAEDAAAARALDMQQEIALFAEQPETVADLPGNLHRPVRRGGCAAAGR